MLKFLIGALMTVGLITAAGAQVVIGTGDSLAVVPAHPTTKDRISLDVIITNWDCCTQYTYDSTVAIVNDTELLVSYQYNIPQVCPLIACINANKVLTYKSAPLTAGTYAVYESRQVLCTTQICPQLAMPILAPVKIGSFVVTSTTGVADRLASRTFSQPKNSLGALACFNARGERLAATPRNGRANGVYVFRSANGRLDMANSVVR